MVQKGSQQAMLERCLQGFIPSTSQQQEVDASLTWQHPSALLLGSQSGHEQQATQQHSCAALLWAMHLALTPAMIVWRQAASCL